MPKSQIREDENSGFLPKIRRKKKRSLQILTGGHTQHTQRWRKISLRKYLSLMPLKCLYSEPGGLHRILAAPQAHHGLPERTPRAEVDARDGEPGQCVRGGEGTLPKR